MQPTRPALPRVALAPALVAPPPGWTLTTDVVVVGSGVAGLTAALRLRRRGVRVVLVTKGGLASGSTVWAQGGIAAALAPGDSAAAHRTDTLVAGAGLCDEAAVDVLCSDGPERVRELASGGARFDRGADGDLALTREGGHHADRIVHAGGDATGAEVSRALVERLAVRADPGLEVVEHAIVVDLLTGAPAAGGPPPVCGVTLHVIGEGRRDGVGAVLAHAVVLATGGIGRLYPSSTNPAAATGDGLAAAVRAGADVADVEFVQFHPTVLRGGGARGQLALVSEAVRGEGAVLLDTCGVRFMTDVHPLAELAPRDVVAHAIERRMAATGSDHVLLDARHLGAQFLRTRFPTIHARLLAEGLDLTTDLVPVTPAQHYHCGGVRTDLDGRTSVPGLWAAGEVACTGVNGANRLASNSLLEGLVFGRRAADDVADLMSAHGSAGRRHPPEAVERPGVPALVPAAIRSHVQRLARTGPGVVRSAEGLAVAAEGLASVATSAGPDVVTHPQTAEWETTNLHQVAVLLTEAAALRVESRGGHFRKDHPARDDVGWGVSLVARRGPEGVLQWRTVRAGSRSGGHRSAATGALGAPGPPVRV